MRSRWPSLREQHARRAIGDYSDTLESGEHGLDGHRVPGMPRGRMVRITVAVMSMAGLILLGLFVMFSVGVAHENAVGMFQKVQTTVSDSPCVHFRSDWFEIITLPKMRHGMVSVRVVSVGSMVVQSGEVLELAGCVGKRIERARHMTISVRYQPLETWPFGRSREIALDGGQAVCVQHALEQFKGNITCDSN
jgi:hypothetical protein